MDSIDNSKMTDERRGFKPGARLTEVSVLLGCPSRES